MTSVIEMRHRNAMIMSDKALYALETALIEEKNAEIAYDAMVASDFTLTVRDLEVMAVAWVETVKNVAEKAKEARAAAAREDIWTALQSKNLVNIE